MRVTTSTTVVQGDSPIEVEDIRAIEAAMVPGDTVRIAESPGSRNDPIWTATITHRVRDV